MAAINRFMKPLSKDYSWQNPTLEAFTPNYDAWMKALDEQQAKYDTIPALSALVPKHLEQDRPDVEAYNKQVQQDLKSVTDAFASGDITKGNQLLREVTNKRKIDFQPGGAADMFQQRLQKYSEIDKQLQETYLDPKSDQYSPELYKYYKGNISVQPYKTDTGYGSIDRPSMYQYFSPEKWTKHIDTILDNIEADQVATAPGLIPSGVSLKSFFKTGKKEYIDKNKVLNALVGSIPPEMLKSLDVYGKATGTDTVSEMQKMLDAAATGKAYSKTSYDYNQVTDEVAMEELKSKLRRQEKKEEKELDNIILRTNIFNANSGMPDWKDFDFNVDSKGNVYTKKTDWHWTPYGSFAEATKTQIGDFKKWVTTGDAPPQIKNIADEFSDALSKMSGEQAMNFVKQKYEEKRQLLSNTDATVQAYDEDNRKRYTNFFFGTTKGKEGAAAGSLFTNDMTVTTIMPGEVSTMTGRELAKKMGIMNTDGTFNDKQLRRLIENGEITEKVDVDSNVMPSGHKGSYVDENGKVWTFVVGPRSIDEETLNGDAYKINQAKYNDAADDYTFQPVHPELRNLFPAGINVKSKDVYASDVAYNQWKNAEHDLIKGNATESQVNDLHKKWIELKNNPYNDSFVGKDVALIDPRTGTAVPLLDDDGKPIKDANGNIRYLSVDDATNLIRNTKIKQ